MANKFIIEIRTQGFKGAKKDFDKLNTQTRSFVRNANKGTSATAGFRRAMSSLRNNLLLVTFAFGGIIVALNKVVKAYREQIEAETRLRASLRNVASASEDGADKLMQLASALQQTTTFGDEQIISGQAMLATFQLNEDAIAALTPRMLDMAAAMGTGGDGLTTIALQLGKAFTGQIGALSRSGVLIDQVALAAARATGPYEEFAFLAGELDKNFQGVAEALALTDLGKIDQLTNKISDMNEEIGRTAVPFKLAMSHVKLFASEALSILTLAMKFYHTETKAAHGSTVGWTVALVKAQQAMAELKGGEGDMPEFDEPRIPANLQKEIDLLHQKYGLVKLIGFELEHQFMRESPRFTSVFANMDLEAQKIAGKHALYRKEMELQVKNAEMTAVFDAMKLAGVELTIEEITKYIALQVKQAEVAQAIAQAEMTGAANMISAFSQLAGQNKNNAILAANLAKASAIISMYAGIMKAYEQGGVLGFVTGATILAQGLANIGQINTQLRAIQSAATGADFVTSGPQMMMVGENPGGMERVQVTPLSSPNIDGPQGGGMTINFNNAVMSEDFTRDQIIPQIKKAVRLNLA